MKRLFVLASVFVLSTLFTCQAATHTVRLDWVASPTAGVTYDVFRGNAPGTESATPIVSGVALLTYTDAAAGDASCWYVKAKLISGGNTLYSVPSNEVCVNYPSAPGTLTATPQ